MNPYEWRYILHADLDAFYASVEQLDNPEYRGHPLVVGGSPEERGVVAAASYEARRYNIHSAMPMRTAMRIFPQLVRVAPRFDRYHQISRDVIGIFHQLTTLVEPIAMDEAYLDISFTVSWENVHRQAHDLKIKIRDQTGLVVSIGGGSSKAVAKVASQLSKPDGLLLVEPGTEQDFLAPLDVGILSGVGPKTSTVMRAHSIATVGDLSVVSTEWLLKTFGKRGPELKYRAMGIDRSQVTPYRETRSVSAEVTMAQDVAEKDELFKSIEDLSLSVASRLQRNNLEGKTVTLKLRLADFTTLTRQRTLGLSTSDASVIGAVACDLLRREVHYGRRFRLVGVGVSRFKEHQSLPLFPQL
jgi:DNA polymerase-4